MDLFEWATALTLENKTITILIVLVCLLYYHYTSTFTFFKERGIPYNTPTIFFGNIGELLFLKTSFHEYNLKLYRDFDGDCFVGYFEGRLPILMIRDPDLIKAILIKDFVHFTDRGRITLNEPIYINKFVMNMKGAEWKAVRGIITPCFTSARIRAMLLLIDECICNMIKRIDANIKDNPELEMNEVMGRSTLKAMCSCAFGVECGTFNDNKSHLIKVAGQFSSISVLKQGYILFMVLLSSEATKYVKLSFWNLKVVRELRNVLIAVKKIRRKVPENMDDDTIDGQALQLLFAGYETTNSLLSFATHLLALHPEVQTKLREEINEVATRYDGEINYDSIGAMQYLEAVMFETLRMYPPLSIIDRDCVKRYTLPGSNVILMPGQRINIPTIGLHMDAKHYPEPEKFKPERFINEEKGTRPSHVYLPFGAGSRNCIGMRFGMVIAKLTIARLITKFELAPCSKTQVPIQLSTKGRILKSESGVWVKVSPVTSE